MEAPSPPVTAGPARSVLLAVGAGLVLLVAVPIVFAYLSTVTHPGLPKGDFAVIEMKALDVPGNLPLTGMYSRYGFDHPGPLLFYVIALPLRLFGPSGMNLAAGLVNLAASVGLLYTLYRRGGQALTAIGAVMVLLVIRSLQIEVVSVWNPWVPILPLALAVALTWSVWCRDWWALPWLAGVSTFIVQSHVGYAMTTGFLLGSSLVWGIVELVRSRRPDDARDDPTDLDTHGVTDPPTKARSLQKAIRTPLIVAAGVLVVLWLPPLIDQLVHDPGNLSALLDFARSGQPGEVRVGAGPGFRILSQVAGVDGALFGGISRMLSGRSLFALEGAPAWKLAVVLVPFLAAAGVAVWRRAHDAVRLAVIVAVMVPLGWLSIAQISGPAFPYLVEWLLVLGAYLWLSTIWSVLTVVWPSIATVSLVPHRLRGRAVLPIVGVATVLVLLGGVATATTVRSPGDGYQGGQVVERFADPAASAASGRGLVLLTAGPVDPTNSAWFLETSAIETGLQAELQRRGFDVVTSDDRAFLVGDDRVVGDRQVGIHLVVSADTGVRPDVDPATTLASFDYLTLDDRREYQALDAKGGTVPPTPLVGAELYRWGDLRTRAVVYELSVAPDGG